MRTHPPEPSTESLHGHFGMPETMLNQTAIHRQETDDLTSLRVPGMLVIVGADTLTNYPDIIEHESSNYQAISDRSEHLKILLRMCGWKPRSDENEPFWGLETVDALSAYIAYKLVHQRALAGTAISFEVGDISHLDRYGHLASHVWLGSRNSNQVLFNNIAILHPSLPLSKKNETSGQFAEALALINTAEQLRGIGGAAITLIYRGGTEVRTPLAWERQILRVLTATEGKVIIDVAHGSERAHHPDFDRSVAGQQAALEHLIDLIGRVGILPLGVMMEASDEPEQPIDPNMPHSYALEAIDELDKLAANLLKPNVSL